jgi:hypothetical protein
MTDEHVSPFGTHLDTRTALLALAVLAALSALLFTVATRQHGDAQQARVLKCQSDWSRASSHRSAILSEINERKNEADGKRLDALDVLVAVRGLPASQPIHDAQVAYHEFHVASKKLTDELQKAYEKYPAPLYEDYCAKALKSSGIKVPQPKPTPKPTVTPTTPITSSPVAKGGIDLSDSDSDSESKTRIIERSTTIEQQQPSSAPTEGGGDSDDGGSKS